MKIQIGDTIKTLRKQQGRTQENVADALGITFQAVSRWESGTAYPDMELVPSIANYFGVSIDELFGYNNERQKKVDALVQTIRDKDRSNNGVDVCIDECIALAREGLVEFPGNEQLLLCLADVLYNAGYAKYGEYHLTNSEGYDVYDTERHKEYSEWKEAISIYEKLVKQLDDGKEKHEVTKYLTQLYVNTGETEKAGLLIETLPNIFTCRDMLAINACDGKQRAEQTEKVLAKLLGICATLFCSTVMVNKNRITNTQVIDKIKAGLTILNTADYGELSRNRVDLYLYLSVFLWREGDKDGAFESLDKALAEDKKVVGSDTSELPSYWPCWCVPDYSDVASEIKLDKRWEVWVKKCSEQ